MCPVDKLLVLPFLPAGSVGTHAAEQPELLFAGNSLHNGACPQQRLPLEVPMVRLLGSRSRSRVTAPLVPRLPALQASTIDRLPSKRQLSVGQLTQVFAALSLFRWAYALLALLDVEANACLVLAYRYTSLTR